MNLSKAVIQLEVDIPELPKPAHKSFGVVIDVASTVQELKPGASFLVDDAKSRNYALIVGNRKNIPITTRKEGARFRIWRKP